jgi:hypothetical protein
VVQIFYFPNAASKVLASTLDAANTLNLPELMQKL